MDIAKQRLWNQHLTGKLLGSPEDVVRLLELTALHAEAERFSRFMELPISLHS